MKYYTYKRYVDNEHKIFSGKYLRFYDDPEVSEESELPENTDEIGYTTIKPDFFLPPFIPYAVEGEIFEWTYQQGPQDYYSVENTISEENHTLSVYENSIYEIKDTISKIIFAKQDSFYKETSVFFTLENPVENPVVFPEGSKVVGSQEYWVSGKSYIITIYNNYYIIGVSKTTV